MRPDFTMPMVIAVGLSIVLTGCGEGESTSITTTTSTTFVAFDAHVKWKFSVLDDVTVGPESVFLSDISVGSSGTVFMPVSLHTVLHTASFDSFIFAIDGNDGEPKWQFQLLATDSSINKPLVGPDDSVSVEFWVAGFNCSGSAMQSVTNDGTGKWTQNFNYSSKEMPSRNIGGGFSDFGVSAGGTVFVVPTRMCEGGALFALDGDTGTIKWHINPVGHHPFSTHIAVGPDDTVFMIAYGVPDDADTPHLFAVRGADGSEKWRSVITSNYTFMGPTLGANGTILVQCSDGLIAFDGQDGAVKWMQPIAYGDIAPAVGPDGTIFVPSARNSSQEGAFLALNGNDGSIKWSYGTNSSYEGEFSSAAVSTDGTVYVCSLNSVHALDSATGNVRWISTSSLFAFRADASPVIGPDGTVFILDKDHGQLMAFHGDGGPVHAPYTAEQDQLRTHLLV